MCHKNNNVIVVEPKRFLMVTIYSLDVFVDQSDYSDKKVSAVCIMILRTGNWIFILLLYAVKYCIARTKR